MIDCDERPGRPPDRTVCGDRRITWSRLAGAVVDAPDSATPSWCVWPWHKCCWDSTSSIGGSGSPHTRIRGGRTSRPPRSGLRDALVGHHPLPVATTVQHAVVASRPTEVCPPGLIDRQLTADAPGRRLVGRHLNLRGSVETAFRHRFADGYRWDRVSSPVVCLGRREQGDQRGQQDTGDQQPQRALGPPCRGRLGIDR